MNKRVVYIVPVLLFLLLLLAVGILAYALFRIQAPRDDETLQPVKRAPPITLPDRSTPVGITTMEIGETSDVGSESTPGTSAVAAASAPALGLIPTVCDDYPPAVRHREAYRNPTIFEADTKADVVAFTIDVGMPGNTR